MTSLLSLGPVGRGDYGQVSHITVAPEDKKFSGTVREAFDADEADVDFHAILIGDTPVGFFKIDRAYARTLPLAKENELGLRAFMVDHAWRGQRIATAAVREMATYLAQCYPQAPSVALTVNMSNPAAIACYLKGGFSDTGDIWPKGDAGPQHVMRMALHREGGDTC